MTRRPHLAAGLALALFAAPHTIAAQSPPSPEQKAAAQALFDDAMALRKRGAQAESCKKLEESRRLDPATGTKFYLAECLEQTGKLASAWLLYTEVADAMASSAQEKREAYARERAAALSPKLARIQIVVPAAARVPGLVVRRDDVVVGEAQWGFAVPVDPGPHAIEARVPDMVPFAKTVEATEPGRTLTVELPAWTPMVPAASASASASASPLPTVHPATSPLRLAGFITGGAGLAGLVAGGVLGIVALSKQADSNRGPCDSRDVCSAAGLALRADAIGAATGSTIAFVASGLALAAGVVLVLLPTKTSAAPSALVLRPGGLAMEGRW